jgi:hypothetical protein
MAINIESDSEERAFARVSKDEVGLRMELKPTRLMLRSGAAPFIALKLFNSRALRRVSKHGRWRGLACGRPSRRAQNRAPQDEVCGLKLHPPDPTAFMIQTGAMRVGGLASQMMPGRIMPGRIFCRGGFQTRPASRPAFVSDVAA